MPETRAEWAVFVLGIAVIAALAVVIVRQRSANHRAQAAQVRTTAARPRPARPTVTTAPHTTSTAVTSTTATTTATTTTTVSLTLAARTDTWLSVRQDSATGPILYLGTLSAGDSRTFSAAYFWVRFGAASNVDATLNGHALPLPAGTYSAPITVDGLGHRKA